MSSSKLVSFPGYRLLPFCVRFEVDITKVKAVYRQGSALLLGGLRNLKKRERRRGQENPNNKRGPGGESSLLVAPPVKVLSRFLVQQNITHPAQEEQE